MTIQGQSFQNKHMIETAPGEERGSNLIPTRTSIAQGCAYISNGQSSLSIKRIPFLDYKAEVLIALLAA
jgi:hypothetical protein